MTARLSCIILVLVIFFPGIIFSESDFLRVTAPGNRQLRLAITPPTPLGSQDAQTAAEIASILQFDLEMTGIFQVASLTTADSPGDADLVLKTSYTATAERITLEFRLVEVQSGRELLAKRYGAARADQRRTAHTFADDIVYSMTGDRSSFTSKLAFISNVTGNKEIHLMDWDGHNVRKLTSNGSINLNPEFSPSGRELIYTSYKKGNPDLYRRELVTGSEARISSGRGINITGAYAPDGNRIALAMSKEGNSEIYVISKEGKQLARLTTNPAIDLSPTWSPDGHSIAFVSDRLGRPQIFMMNSDGSNQRRLTTSGGYNVSPRWSPKGDRIAYCRQYGNGFQIHVINPDGTEDRQLTFEGSNEHPRWSPDGRFIVFSSKRGGKESIYTMRADGSAQTKISRTGGSHTHPTWSARL